MARERLATVEMAVEESPLGPYMEVSTANRDRREGFAT